MRQRAYEIRETNTGFLYHEFSFCYGWMSDLLNDVYENFATKAEAEAYGKERGAFDAYGY